MPDVEGALGTPSNDTLTGSPTVATDNALVGYAGFDTLDGKAGDDTLTGGPGFDTMLGDTGNDLLAMVDGESDNGDCGAGADRVLFDDGLETPTNCETLQPSAASLATTAAADPRSTAFRDMERRLSRLARVR